MTPRYVVRAVLSLLDIAGIFLAFWLAWLTRFRLLPPYLPGLKHVEQPWSLYLQIIALCAVLVIFFAARERLFRFDIHDMRRQVFGSFKVVGWLFLVIVAYMAAFRLNFEFSRLGTLIAMFYLAQIMPLLRLCCLALVHRWKLLAERSLIIGPPEAVRAFLGSVGEERYARRNRILMRITAGELLDESGGDFRLSVDGEIDRLIREEGLSKAVVFMEGIPRRQLATILRKFEIRLRVIKLIPDASSLALAGSKIHRLESSLLLDLEQSLWRPWNRLLKRAFDLLITVPLLPLVLVSICYAAPLLRWKPLRKIERFDFSRRPFHLLQLDADVEGRSILFQSGLYKLPELLGVLTGRQSLVGPAPLIEREFPVYADTREAFSSIRPGITGLWQISDYGYFHEEQRLSLDMYYAMNWSLGLDLKIIFESTLKGFYSLWKPRSGGMRA